VTVINQRCRIALLHSTSITDRQIFLVHAYAQMGD
jgi:hypothetical protein